ncbi:hypothetical protein MAPG_04294 [Magnaporthiopsis poae ATCC 64411]|uniref:Uncharacterized protein n=1 Tax=Magnaporthiopsis poae (strain ATCC 64411 / 73-15) TaxID=644358 RepID=A0A0C4DWB8_MAGP6|nr:hypothetical protein MAPG_04294 [Magnaporthiopsis poae ATCC 64411]
MMADITAQVSHASAAAAPMDAVEPIPAQRSTTTPESAAAQQNTDNVPIETSDGASDVTDGESEFGDDFFRDWFGYEPPDIFPGLLGDDAIDEVETVVQRSAEAENVGHRASQEQQQQEAARTLDTPEQAEVAAPEPRASEPRTVTPEPDLSTTERPAQPTATAAAKPVLNEAHARRDRLLGRGLMSIFRRRHGKQGISMLSSCLKCKGTKKPVTTV